MQIKNILIVTIFTLAIEGNMYGLKNVPVFSPCWGAPGYVGYVKPLFGGKPNVNSACFEWEKSQADKSATAALQREEAARTQRAATAESERRRNNEKRQEALDRVKNLKMDTWEQARAEGRGARIDLPYGSYLKHPDLGTCGHGNPDALLYLRADALILQSVMENTDYYLICSVNGVTSKIKTVRGGMGRDSGSCTGDIKINDQNKLECTKWDGAGSPEEL